MSGHEMTKKQKKKRTTSGKTKIVYKKNKPAKKKCALCDRQLHGVPHSKSISEISKLSKTQKRPNVIFGGVLCNKCRENIIREAALVKTKEKKIEEVLIKKRKFTEEVLNRC